MVTKRAFMSASNAAPKRAMKWRARTLSPWKLFRSAPAEKNLSPAPVSTAAYTVRSSLSRASSASSSRSASGVHVLAGGLSMVMNAVWPLISCLIIVVIPAKAGIQPLRKYFVWVPAFAGTTLEFHVLQDHAREILGAVAVDRMLLV